MTWERTNRDEPAPNHHPHKPILGVRMPALLPCATQVVLLEPRRDKEREADSNQDRAEHKPRDTVGVAVFFDEDDGETEEERVLREARMALRWR